MDNITANNEPRMVSVKDFRIDADYATWLSEIKRRYISAQIKASIKINTEKLRFNWSVGRDLVMRKAEERWGSGVVEQFSLDLQAAFPQANGDAIEKLHQLGGVSDLSWLLGLVPWRHQVSITTKCKFIDEAIFYLRECISGGWSRQTLDN